MNATKFTIAAALSFELFIAGCQPNSAPTTKTKATVYRLFDLFRPEDLAGKVTPEDAGWKRVEWNAPDLVAWTPPTATAETNAPSAQSAAAIPTVSYRPLHDIANLKLDQGKLAGDLTGPAPVLAFSFRDNRGGAESAKFIEVRMTVSGAKEVWLRPEGPAAVDEKGLVTWAGQTNAWITSAPIVEGKPQTYRFEIKPNAGLGGGPPPAPPAGPAPAGKSSDGPAPAQTNAIAAAPPATPPAPARPGPPPGPPPGFPGAAVPNGNALDLHHFALAFRDGQSGKFAIESVRLVTAREEKLKEPSGQQWAGLAEIYHASLAAKTPETIRIPLRDLPDRPWLELAIGTQEDTPVKFTVSIANREGAKESTPVVLFERTVTIPNRWQNVRLDLAGYTGKNVSLELSLSGETKGLWGYWGSPVVRSHIDPGSVVAAGANSAGKRKPRGVILLVIDTLRKDHLNIYGYPRETVVHLKKFAADGVAFNHAISQATMTKISVPSIVTSLYPLSHTVLGFDHGLPASAKTIAEVFRDEGYATVAYSSVPFTGKMNNMHQGYDELHEVASVSDPEYHSKTARHYVDRLIPWLEEHKDEPFFAFLHVFDPHSPFRPRPPYDTIWGAPGAKERLAALEADMKKHEIQTSLDNLPPKSEYLKTGHDPAELLKIYMDWYDGSIRGVDAEIGRLLEALRNLGLEQDTLMVWATDHGEEFWEHGRLFHGQSVYGELNQVPMVYRWPNSPDIRKGVMVDQQVQNLDIMPTILELAGIQGPSSMQGKSLVPLLNGSGVASWQEQPAITQAMVSDNMDPRPPSMGGPAKPGVERAHFGIIDHGWKLVRKELDPDPQQELYQHPIDNLNLTNLLTSDGVASRVKGLADSLDSWKTKARAAQLPSDDSVAQQVSSEELRRLRALGYVGGGAPTAATNKPTSTNPAPRTAP